MTDTEIKDSAMVICNQKYNEIEAPYRRKEFKCWLNSQIEFGIFIFTFKFEFSLNQNKVFNKSNE